jgi:hypothetical protein
LHKSNSSARRLSANSLRTVIKARSSSMLY